MAGPKVGQCWGPKHFTQSSKKLAHLLHYDNPDTNTGHSNRKAGVTVIQNTEGIGAGLKLSMCRHKGEVVTSGYDASTQMARDRASAALMNVSLPSKFYSFCLLCMCYQYLFCLFVTMLSVLFLICYVIVVIAILQIKMNLDLSRCLHRILILIQSFFDLALLHVRMMILYSTIQFNRLDRLILMILIRDLQACRDKTLEVRSPI